MSNIAIFYWLFIIIYYYIHLHQPKKVNFMYAKSIRNTTLRTASSEQAMVYWITLGSVLAIGFGLNIAMVKSIPIEAVMSINKWVLIIGYFICAFTGIIVSKSSNNPTISFIGFLMVVIPVGVISIPFIGSKNPDIVEKAAIFTAILSMVMGFAGAVFSKMFRSIGGILFWALLAAIIAEVVLMLLGYNLAIMDWIIAAIFLGLIAYDFANALDDPASMDAAVDRAVDLYLDIFNLFIRILSIMSDD